MAVVHLSHAPSSVSLHSSLAQIFSSVCAPASPLLQMYSYPDHPLIVFEDMIAGLGRTHSPPPIEGWGWTSFAPLHHAVKCLTAHLNYLLHQLSDSQQHQSHKCFNLFSKTIHTECWFSFSHFYPQSLVCDLHSIVILAHPSIYQLIC